MALDPTAFAAAKLAAYDSAGRLSGMDQAAKDKLQADWEFDAQQLFNYMITNTVVNTTVAPAIPVQVTPATGTGATTGPGAGTGTIS